MFSVTFALQLNKFFAISVYDTKPIHMLSTVKYWVLKKRKVWSAVHREILEIGFLRLNFIDNYNNNMNLTDIADQLRGSYRPDRWMRQWKWWWAFFIWGVRVAAVNTFKMYDSMYEECCNYKLPTRVCPQVWTPHYLCKSRYY